MGILCSSWNIWVFCQKETERSRVGGPELGAQRTFPRHLLYGIVHAGMVQPSHPISLYLTRLQVGKLRLS